MAWYLQLVLFYLIGINIWTFIIYGVDKWKSKKGKWRVPEGTLLSLALFGGSIGALLGIQLWSHKTLHKKFIYGVPAILLLQIALAVYLWI